MLINVSYDHSEIFISHLFQKWNMTSEKQILNDQRTIYDVLQIDLFQRCSIIEYNYTT